MGVHFIPVEVGVVGLAVGVVQPQHLLPGQDPRAVGLDGGSVQGGLPVQQQHVPVLNVPTHLPQRLGCCLTTATTAIAAAVSPQEGLVYL